MAPGKLRTFEVQTFRNGQWTIDSVYDDRDLALFEAQRLTRMGRFLGVRVLEEFLGTEGSKTRIIFRGEPPKRSRKKPGGKILPESRPAAKSIKKRSHNAALANRYHSYLERMDGDRYRLLMICLFVIMFGLAALIGLEASRV